MLKIGEDTGAMDEALLNVSYFYNREVKESIEKLEPAMMPILTIILGGIMLWIMMAVLGPVYDAVSNIKI
jgi:type IV pilus assembly protein PilC